MSTQTAYLYCKKDSRCILRKYLPYYLNNNNYPMDENKVKIKEISWFLTPFGVCLHDRSKTLCLGQTMINQYHEHFVEGY